MINPFIQTNLATNTAEQNLLHGLVEESIQFNGIDFIYLPRTMNNEDLLFHEATQSTFSQVFTIEGYLESVEAFEGDGDMLSGLGLSIKDQASIQFAQRRFLAITGKNLPVEGDLIYYKNAKSIFEIKFVQNESQFYPMGTLPSFKITAEKYEYSGETFATGIPELDALNDTVVDAVGDTVAVVDSFNEANISIQTEADSNFSFQESNPFGQA